MKAYKIIGVLTLCLCLCGCDLWLDGSYYSIEPNHSKQNLPNTDTEELSTYAQIRDSLLEMVGQGVEKRVLYTTGIDGEDLQEYVKIAADYVTKSDPVGSYAVENIDYDVGTNSAKSAVSVEITYAHGRSQILRIKQASGKEQTEEYIADALDKCEAGVVIHTEDYDNTDYVQFVKDYVDANPQKCMEMPQVTAAVYPERGNSRVIELSFQYQTSRDDLRSMQAQTQPIFASAKLYVSGDTDEREKYVQLYSFLMERFDYELETSITPAYSLLRHGVGDSKAFAVVYAAMCRDAGIECEVVSGTKGGKPYFWNGIPGEDEYVYLDLLSCVQTGGFRIYVAENMEGYVWDYSDYDLAQ